MGSIEEELTQAERREAFLDDVIRILGIERNLLSAKAEGKETKVFEVELQEEVGRCYGEYHTALDGTPEARYLNQLIVYYRVQLPEGALQKTLDMDIDDFIDQHNLPTRTANCIMNALYDSRRGRYHLGELLVVPEVYVARRGCGKRTMTLKQIKDALAEEGLYLGMLESYTHGKGYTIISSQKTS